MSEPFHNLMLGNWSRPEPSRAFLLTALLEYRVTEFCHPEAPLTPFELRFYAQVRAELEEILLAKGYL